MYKWFFQTWPFTKVINYFVVYYLVFLSLKRLFTNFEYITFFSCPTERNIFYKRFILIKPLCLEIIEKKGCTNSVRVIYIIYIIVLGRTDFVHPFFSIISMLFIIAYSYHIVTSGLCYSGKWEADIQEMPMRLRKIHSWV